MDAQRVVIVLAALLALSYGQSTDTTTLVTEILTSLIMDNGTTLVTMETTTATAPPTTAPGPTPCSAADWIVRDSHRDVCMLMSFKGYITYIGHNYTIPDKTSVQYSTCDDQKADFNLWYVADDGSEDIWHIVLRFTKEDSKHYQLVQVTNELYYPSGVLIYSSTTDADFFTVPVGKHYTCDVFKALTMTLTSPVFQPFVKDTEGGCGLGEADKCGSGGGKSSNTGLIVGCVVGGLVVAAGVGWLVYILMRNRKEKKNYSQF